MAGKPFAFQLRSDGGPHRAVAPAGVRDADHERGLLDGASEGADVAAQLGHRIGGVALDQQHQAQRVLGQYLPHEVAGLAGVLYSRTRSPLARFITP